MALTQITSKSITDGTIATADIADGAVTNAKIADGTIGSAKIGTGSIAASNLNAASVTTNKIADEAVTLAKLPHGTSSNDGKFLRANNGADPTFETVASAGKAHNLIINGSMQAAQRGTSSTGNGYQTVDRFSLYKFAIGNTLTQSQISLNSTDTGPYALGFRKAYRFAAAGALTVNNNSEISMSYKIESQDLAKSGWDYTSSSSYITLSFWFRCSANQTFYCYLKTNDGTSQSYPFSFTASGNNTWTKITKTIPGDSNLQFDDNNEEGLYMAFVPFFGTNYTGTKTLNAWSAYANDARVPDMTNDVWYDGANTFDITGVQLEVGSVATDFEHRSFAQEIALCKRYFEKVMVTSFDSKSNNNHTGGASAMFAVEKRDAPTCTRISNYYEYNSGGQLTAHTITTFAILVTCSGGGNKSQQLLSSLFHCEAEL